MAGIGEQTAQVGAIVATTPETGRNELDKVRVAVAGGELHQAEPVAMRIEAHGLGIDSDDGTQGEAFRQIVPVQMDGAAWHELGGAHCVGAQEKTRTSTTLRPQVPETCASTNSATWAIMCPATIAGAVVGRAM